MTFRKALLASFEWRVVAFAVTFLFFMAHGLPLTKVGMFTIQLQLLLFAVQALWIWLKARP